MIILVQYYRQLNQQFSDTFSGFTLFVEKLNNELQNIFLHDSSGSLNNLSSNISDTAETTIIAENGLVERNIHNCSTVKLF